MKTTSKSFSHTNNKKKIDIGQFQLPEKNWNSIEIQRSYFDNYLEKALKTIYPEYNWKTWEFGIVQHGDWHAIENQRSYFDNHLSTQLKITEQRHWYQKTTQDVSNNELLRWYYNCSLQKALETIYPE